MLRATYDSNGNIILGVPLQPRDRAELETPDEDWKVIEEKRTEVVRTEIRSPVPAPKKASLLGYTGTEAKKILKNSAVESGRQFSATTTAVKAEFSVAAAQAATVPERFRRTMRRAWKAANTPVQLPGRKPGKRAPKKLTLFLVDTVRFGGTFGLIFGILFVGINYQSFWQIAKAQLAIGADLGTEQALRNIGQSQPPLYATDVGTFSEGINILKYLPLVGPFEDRIVIPKLGKNIPIVRPSMESLMKEDWKRFEEDIQTALHGGVVHYPGSARPGQAGNFFVTGHSSYYPWDSGRYKDVFARLHELESGDTYSVYYGGDRHTYKITRKYEVRPSDVSVLDQPSTKRMATLMTCTPVGTTLRRLIVEAEEIDPSTGVALQVGEKVADKPMNPFARLEALPI